MTDILDPLIRDLVEWVAKEPRPYSEVMAAWRTSCPRLAVWEEADERGYIERRHVSGEGAFVFATDAGRKFLMNGDQPGAGASQQANSVLSASR
jgi:hypothetical protein